MCRKFDKKDLFIKRCKDTVNDDRGFIIPLDDEDLTKLVELRKKDLIESKKDKLFINRFREIVS